MPILRIKSVPEKFGNSSSSAHASRNQIYLSTCPIKVGEKVSSGGASNMSVVALAYNITSGGARDMQSRPSQENVIFRFTVYCDFSLNFLCSKSPTISKTFAQAVKHSQVKDLLQKINKIQRLQGRLLPPLSKFIKGTNFTKVQRTKEKITVNHES